MSITKCICTAEFCVIRNRVLPTSMQAQCAAGNGAVVDVLLAEIDNRAITPRPKRVKKPRARLHRELVGTCLTKRIAGLLTIQGSATCNCESLAKQMDAWGIAGCEENREFIIGKLVDNRHLLAAAMSDSISIQAAIGWVINSPLATPILRQGANWFLDAAIADARTQSMIVYTTNNRERSTHRVSRVRRLDSRPKNTTPRDIIRVGLASHGVYEGGVEEWFRCLATGNRDPTIKYVAIGVFDSNKNTSHRDLGIPIVPHGELHHHCDIILGWATDLSHLRNWPGQIVYVAHGATGWTRRWLSQYADFSDALVAVSEVSREAIDLPNHVQVIRNGVDLSRLITPHDRMSTTPTLGYLGRWSTEKRAHLVAEAAQQIGCRAAFLIPEDKRTIALRDLRSISVDIDWYTTPQLKEFLARISCLVVPSQHEGGPLVVAEAWASGVPVACTQVGMVPELETIHGSLTIPLSNPPTVTELGSILTRIDPQVTSLAYHVAVEHLTKERMAAEYAALFRKLIPRP